MSPLSMAMVAAAADTGTVRYAAARPERVRQRRGRAAASASASLGPGRVGFRVSQAGVRGCIERTPAPATSQLPANVVSDLHTMMASVVNSGTAAGQGLPAGTYAKTGTAEYGTATPLKTDAWLMGFKGDTAFACLVVDSTGDGGPTCGPIVAKFLADLA